MSIYFFIAPAPLWFIDSTRPDLKVIAGQFASVELPELSVEDGYNLKEVIVQHRDDILSDDIYYDP